MADAVIAILYSLPQLSSPDTSYHTRDIFLLLELKEY